MEKQALTEILRDRGEKYGPFMRHAQISQDIKQAIFKYTKGKEKLSDDKIEALEMIAHKIARIINGDPNYADSWDDIAGYATLIANNIKEAHAAITKTA